MQAKGHEQGLSDDFPMGQTALILPHHRASSGWEAEFSKEERAGQKPGGSLKALPHTRGSALLAVLWLAAALSAIAFSVANTVRGETERTSTSVEGTRAYYLAAGAVDRAVLYMLWGSGYRNPDGSPRFWERGLPRLHFLFPAGEAIVEIIPATARLNVNFAAEEDLYRLLVTIGAEPLRAAEITQAILDWRSPVPGGGLSPFDQHYLSLTPSFRARHASFEEVEELLLVKGMTPGLFYGTYVRDPEGRLVRRSGLKDCVSVYGSTNYFDVNTADPALLLSAGIRPDLVRQIVEMRRIAPIVPEQLNTLRQFGGPEAAKLGIGGNSIFTLRAVARLRTPAGNLSDTRRSVAATVKFWDPRFHRSNNTRRFGRGRPYEIIRWYDQAPADSVEWP